MDGPKVCSSNVMLSFIELSSNEHNVYLIMRKGNNVAANFTSSQSQFFKFEVARLNCCKLFHSKIKQYKSQLQWPYYLEHICDMELDLGSCLLFTDISKNIYYMFNSTDFPRLPDSMQIDVFYKGKDSKEHLIFLHKFILLKMLHVTTSRLHIF